MKSLLLSALATVAGLLLALAASDGGQLLLDGLPVMMVLVLLAYVLNWVVYGPSYRAQTERFFDLTGSLTFQLVTVLALVLVADRDARTWVLAAMVLLWALRLGMFLFRRVTRAGKDGRFDELKTSWSRFLMVWTVQALWVTFTAGAALAAITSGERSPLGVLGYAGILVWVTGFAVEALADAQKSAFRADPRHQGEFVRGGLWSVSRHPNYVGEILLWTGVAMVAAAPLVGWQHVTLVSPVLIYLLLRFGSGVPALERRADERWGGRADYEAWKARTPVLFPVPRAGADRSR
ncbi:DUF1295 domain-containing protein [uncultured Serinicoccus sp.]|uniref:DUF1295 domain-containing protein n=1 Tax=uncultured Serinicoccus sp. TaxID=735514 RepID=UPI0026125C8D|nr:DUF1295 domain-containing protein [uncultured Serinicoccus sp.]